jgi:hypothetical protein
MNAMELPLTRGVLPARRLKLTMGVAMSRIFVVAIWPVTIVFIGCQNAATRRRAAQTRGKDGSMKSVSGRVVRGQVSEGRRFVVVGDGQARRGKR